MVEKEEKIKESVKREQKGIIITVHFLLLNTRGFPRVSGNPVKSKLLRLQWVHYLACLAAQGESVADSNNIALQA